MVRYLLFSLLLFSTFQASAIQRDTTAYQTQRLKVNSLLAERSAKFGQYDKSLDTKTGIFGLQTKGDIKKSNEILRQIVLADNNIFKELKILMDYKDQEIKQVQNEAAEVNKRMQNYMQLIKKLQDQNEVLKKQSTHTSSFASYIIALLIIALLGTIYFFNKKRKQPEAKF